MSIRVATFRLAIGMALVTLVCGLAIASPLDQLKLLLMRTTSRMSTSPDYALVTFLSLSSGSASVDPLRGSTIIWDGDSLVGLVTPHQALQYKAAPGKHVFVLYDRNTSGINAQLLPGKSYYVNLNRGLLIGVSLEPIKPTDPRINPWPASLEVVALDAAAWDAQQQKAGCNYLATRKMSPKLCRELESQRREDIELVRRGTCASLIPANCKYIALGPEDGGWESRYP